MTRLTQLTLALGATILTTLGLATTPAQAIDPPGHGHIRPPTGPGIHPRGLNVTRVVPGSPAFVAGLERGDNILAVDGRRVNTPDELHRLLHRTGRRAELTVRDSRTGRLVRLHVFTHGGHIGVSVSPIYF
jgi:S1-C subfamily serine protease